MGNYQVIQALQALQKKMQHLKYQNMNEITLNSKMDYFMGYLDAIIENLSEERKEIKPAEVETNLNSIGK